MRRCCGRLSRLTLGHRLQVAPRIGGPSGNVATVNRARMAGATHVMDSVADQHSVVYSLHDPGGTTTNFTLETADVLDAEERAIAWALRVLAIGISPVERENLVAQSTERPDARSALLEGRGFLRSNDPAAVEAASASFDKAIEADPCVCAGLCRDPPWFGARDSSATMMSPRQRRRWRDVESPFRKNRHFPRAIPALG